MKLKWNRNWKSYLLFVILNLTNKSQKYIPILKISIIHFYKFDLYNPFIIPSDKYLKKVSSWNLSKKRKKKTKKKNTALTTLWLEQHGTMCKIRGKHGGERIYEVERRSSGVRVVNHGAINQCVYQHARDGRAL